VNDFCHKQQYCRDIDVDIGRRKFQVISLLSRRERERKSFSEEGEENEYFVEKNS
jgi:hypothetical protein